MRLGLLIYGDLATQTGGYLYDRMLVQGLTEIGHDVRVISVPRRCCVESNRNGSNSEFKRLLMDLDVDILLEDELCHPSLCDLNHSLKDRVEYDIVAIVHGLSRSLTRSKDLRKSLDRLERSFLRSVDAFVFNSRSTRTEVEALVGRSTYGTVAYPGKDHFLPPPLPKDFDKTLRLVHVANISDYKGLDVLIEGLTNHSDFSLAVVGRIIDPAFFDYVQQLIKERGLENKVRFLGLQSGERVHQQLEKSHIFALPSFYESFGIAYIEALGHGLPIIGTNSGGIKEIITDGEEGFLVPSGNPEMIAQHLEEMQEDRSMLRRMSKAALERYRSLPTWGESVNRIHDLLLSLKN